MTKVFVEQPRLNRVCSLRRKLLLNSDPVCISFSLHRVYKLNFMFNTKSLRSLQIPGYNYGTNIMKQITL